MNRCLRRQGCNLMVVCASRCLCRRRGNCLSPFPKCRRCLRRDRRGRVRHPAGRSPPQCGSQESSSVPLLWGDSSSPLFKVEHKGSCVSSSWQTTLYIISRASRAGLIPPVCSSVCEPSARTRSQSVFVEPLSATSIPVFILKITPVSLSGEAGARVVLLKVVDY